MIETLMSYQYGAHQTDWELLGAALIVVFIGWAALSIWAVRKDRKR
jgi:hypothetical protein